MRSREVFPRERRCPSPTKTIRCVLASLRLRANARLRANILALLLTLTLPLLVAAQPRVQVSLEKPPADSFYRIVLTPALLGWARADLSDLQLRDAANQPVPYLLDTLTTASAYALINYPLLSVQHDSVKTYVELSVPEPGTAGFLIRFAATAAKRPAALLGSKDRQHWYSIADDLLLQPTPRGTTGIADDELQFPFSRYPYLRLEIRNGKSAPLLPVQAGRVAGGTRATAWNEAVRLNHAQYDSARYSVVRVFNRQHVLLERLAIDVRKPFYYARNVQVSGLRNNAWVPVGTGVLATGTGVLELPGVKDEQLELRIENGDNPPLQIGSVSGTQRAYVLVTHLDKDGRYTLYAGDPGATAPDYDLAAFRDRIPSNPPALAYGAIEEREGAAATAAKKGNGKVWVWIGLIAGLGVLAWLVRRLVKEV